MHLGEGFAPSLRTELLPPRRELAIHRIVLGKQDMQRPGEPRIGERDRGRAVVANGGEDGLLGHA